MTEGTGFVPEQNAPPETGSLTPPAQGEQISGPGYVPPDTDTPETSTAAQPSVPAGYVDATIVQGMIEQALARQTAQHAEDMQNLRKSLVPGAPSPVPEHAAGVGLRVHDTWSLFEQELARLGNHPDQKVDA